MSIFTETELKFLSEIYGQDIVFSPTDFMEDIDRFSLIYKLIKTYHKKGTLNIRQALNNFIILENVFGSVSVGFLVKKCPDEYKPILFAVLEYTGRLPNHLKDIVDKDVLEEISNL